MEKLGKSAEKLQQQKERYQSQYRITRAINQFVSSYDFRTTKAPYHFHITFDNTQKALFIGGDNTFSWIDIKSTDFKKAKGFLYNHLKQVLSTDNGKALLKEIFGDKITQETISTEAICLEIAIVLMKQVKEEAKNNNELADRKVKINKEKSFGAKKDNPKVDQRTAVLQKLYNDTNKHSDTLRDKENEKDIYLNESGRTYFSHILSDLYSYYVKTNFLGKNREDKLFPDNIYSNIRDKLSKKTTLRTDEICDFILFLIQEVDCEVLGDMSEQEKHHLKGIKKLMVNQARGMLYDEQEYDYYTMKEITKDFTTTVINRDQDKQLAKSIDDKYDANHIYTEGSFKGLPSAASKELRREEVKDMLRARTWINENMLIDKETRSSTIQNIFTNQIDKLREYYESQGYELIIDNIELANKFKSGEIVIEEEEINSINNTLQTLVSQEDKPNQTGAKKEKKLYSYDLSSTNHLSESGKQAVQKVLDKDNAKTGGNGKYADIKIRMSYRLRSKNTGEIIEKTGGYEHQIVSMDAENEAGLSEHNIILDPKKTIVNMIRTKSTVGVDEFEQLVTGGLDTLIRQLHTRNDYLQSPSRDNSRPPKHFIQTQFDLRNKIPPEFGLGNNNTYLSIANNPVEKNKLESSITEYLLKDLFKSGIIHRYFYDSDDIGDYKGMINGGLNNKSSSLIPQYDDEMITKTLTSKEKDKFRICGGGASNMTYGLRNGTFSESGVIGVYVSGGIEFFRVSDLAGILSDSLQTNINQGGRAKVIDMTNKELQKNLE